MVECAVKVAKGIPVFVGAMSSLTSWEGACSERRARTTRSAIQGIAKQTVRIIVGAYDGESVLIWSK
jgi:hypothetical protein